MTIEQNKTSFEHNGRKYNVSVKWNCSRRAMRTNIFVSAPSLDFDPQETLGALAESLGSGTIYSDRGDFPELDKAWDKANRALIKSQRVLVSEAVKALGGEEPMKIAFSRYAGCSQCPCSPGFKIVGTPRDIWITEVDPNAEIEDEEWD